MQLIIPGNYAQGAFASRATTVPHTSSTTKPNQAAGSSSTSMAPLPPVSEEATSSSSTTDSDMEIDDSSESSFTSSTKRSFDMSSESGSESSTHHSATDIDPATDSPAAKRRKTSKFAGERLAGRPTDLTGESEDITLAIALAGIQETINRMTDILERSLAQQLSQPPPSQGALEQKERALKFVHERDDGFDVAERDTLISIFEAQPTTIDIYLALTDSELRRAWISDLLSRP